MNERVPFLVFACIIAAIIGCLYLIDQFTEEELPTYRIGERQVYGVKIGGENIGKLELRIENTTVIEGVKTYVGHYDLYIPASDMARSGVLKFDEKGRLLRAAVAQAKENALEWKVEVGYSFKDKMMRVIVEDNRDPDNYRETDKTTTLSNENIIMPEHLWYLLRTQDIRGGFQLLLRLNLLPNPVVGPISPFQNVIASFKVTGSETVKTPAGTFNAWIIEGENTRLASWPIDKIWISKDTGVIVKAIETQKGGNVQYMLERFET